MKGFDSWSRLGDFVVVVLVCVGLFVFCFVCVCVCVFSVLLTLSQKLCTK